MAHAFRVELDIFILVSSIVVYYWFIPYHCLTGSLTILIEAVARNRVFAHLYSFAWLIFFPGFLDYFFFFVSKFGHDIFLEWQFASCVQFIYCSGLGSSKATSVDEFRRKIVVNSHFIACIRKIREKSNYQIFTKRYSSLLVNGYK